MKIFCGLPDQIFFDTRLDGNKQFFSLAKLLISKEFISDYFVLVCLITWNFNKKGLFDSEALPKPCQISMMELFSVNS